MLRLLTILESIRKMKICLATVPVTLMLDSDVCELSKALTAVL